MKTNKPNNQNKSLIRQALYHEFHLPFSMIQQLTGGTHRNVSNSINPPKTQTIWPWSMRTKAQKKEGIEAARKLLEDNGLADFNRQRYNMEAYKAPIVQALKYHFNLSGTSISRILNMHRRNVWNALKQKEWLLRTDEERELAVKLAREKYQEYYLSIRDNL